MGKRELLEDLGYALYKTLAAHAVDFLISGLLLKPMSKAIVATTNPTPYKGVSRLLSARTLATKAPDGAFIDGPVPIGSAKFAIRKGLPGPDEKRLAIENDPHTVDDFDGEIKEGYGKGTKKLLWSGNAIIKQRDSRWISKVNIHEHNADRAGLHYDFVAEGVKPGSGQFEINIPGGPNKGRYAFVPTDNGMLITRMKDRGIVLSKPTFHLKDVNFLKDLDKNPNDTIVEWKPDGSLANVVITGDRAIFRSHRDTGETYYDRLPMLEDLSNHSGLMTNRLLFSGPNLDGSVFKGELFHPEGAARVAGILNSAPDKAITYQQKNGPVTFIVWDKVKHNGKDISHLPYAQRREMYVNDIAIIRRFNNHWSAVPSRTRDFVSWYHDITRDKRGLPFSEGVVVKNGMSTSSEPWAKVKLRETMDVRILEVIEGSGKYAGSTGRILVETDGGGRGEIGSFAMPDWQRKQIFVDRDIVQGQVIEILAQEITKAGAPRAGVMIRFHPSKSDYGFYLDSKAIADVDGRQPNEVMYAMKSAAGWRKK